MPSYGTVVLDEAFDKADHCFTTTAMDIFKVFGFHMVLSTPLKLIQTLEPYIGSIASVHCEDSKHSTLQVVTMHDAEDEVKSHGETIGGAANAGEAGDGSGGASSGGEAGDRR
jgi:uncharacterized protein YPO0396